ncbi:MAG TPA: CusA/CzcA family heavy metal efflux RND transporter [Burkholderiaceae bacterium]|nr:CusA/CzcA family heavy metal efflux RND transporter [Burkholderiaceae bacterium]
MIARIVRFALYQPLLVVLSLAVFVGGGFVAFDNLPIEAFPDVSDTQVTVIALHPGRAAEEVERQVTLPIEVALSGVPDSVRLFSHTQFGLSFTVITFNDRPNDQLARQRVNERLQNLGLPEGVELRVQPPQTAIGEIVRFRLRGDGHSPQQLREIQDWIVEKQIRKVPGVADLVTMGGTIKQYEVNPDMARLRDHGLSLGQLFAALQRANSNAGGGAVTRGAQQYLIRSIGELRSSADIGNVMVAVHKGVPVLVKDVADVRVGGAPAQGLVGQTIEGRDDDDIVNGIVVMRKGENPSRVLAALKERIDEVNRSHLPRGVEIVPYYDRSWLIDRTLRTVFGNLLEGAVLVCAVLVLFLTNLRAALIVAAVIPLSLLATFLGLTVVGIPANLLSLGAMDFGIIVDGAVIVVENIFRRLGQLRDDEVHDPAVRRAAVLEAAVEVGRPTLFSMLIIIVAHVPIFTLQRHEGRIFSPMAWTVSSALVGSLILSLTVVPLACAWFLRRVPHGDNRVVRFAKARYAAVLDVALARRRAVVAAALLALAGAGVVATRLGSEFLPELNEGSIWVNVTLAPSISPEAAQRSVRAIRGAIATVPEVASVISKAGRPDDGTDPKIFNGAEFFVEMKPETSWRAGATKASLVREMEAAIGVLPGLEPSFSQPIRDNVLESISQIDGQIVIKVQGDDSETLKRIARAIRREIATVPGVTRSFVDRDGQLPQFRIDIDRATAARYGVNVADLQEVVESALAGRATSELWEGERHFSVVVRLNPEQRELTRLPDVLVGSASGAPVPLSQLATFRMTEGAMNISRENGQRVAAIGVFIRDRDMGSVVADMQRRVDATVSLPAGYRLAWSGEFENQQRAMARLSWVVPLSILLIFLLLFDAFKSLASAALIVANIPLAMIGGIVALWATGIALSVSAAIGFIALFGQAVLNGVVMVSDFNARCAGLVDPDEIRAAVREGALMRLRTVLMTALLAMFGLLPMALSHGIGAETQRPLAVVVIGGLFSATLLTLVALPALYLAVARRWPKALATGGDALPAH